RKAGDASKPLFKPRKAKKATDSAYRDRAAERREGEGNDFAGVEALLEDFERRAADEGQDQKTIEQQRRYLGGDSEHSVLVKGLDFALLQQNKAKAAAFETDDDAMLEEAFSAAPEPAATTTASRGPKKRTRDELLGALRKGKEGDGSVASAADTKLNNKFKPIGFKPIGTESDAIKPKKKKKKRAAEGEDGGRKTKKRKVDESNTVAGVHTSAAMPPKSPSVQSSQPKTKAAEPESLAEDVAIFADAGDYDGLGLLDDDADNVDDEDTEPPQRLGKDVKDESAPSISQRGRWFTPSPESESAVRQSLSPGPSTNHTDPSRKSGHAAPEEQYPEDDGQPVRLVPLASSALPSIKDFLKMDDAVNSHQKKKQRKEKKKKAGGGGGDAKVDRDYQRLKSYTEKKAAAGTS
ncbi:hypothetical protein FISHEDRAFT_36328, partial [Fistulina hepatica ATCC 64428]